MLDKCFDRCLVRSSRRKTLEAMEDSKKKKAYPRPPSGYQEESFLATSITGSYKINRVGDSASGNTRKNDYPSSLLNSQMSIYSSSVMNKDTSQIYQ